MKHVLKDAFSYGRSGVPANSSIGATNEPSRRVLTAEHQSVLTAALRVVVNRSAKPATTTTSQALACGSLSTMFVRPTLPLAPDEVS